MSRRSPSWSPEYGEQRTTFQRFQQEFAERRRRVAIRIAPGNDERMSWTWWARRTRFLATNVWQDPPTSSRPQGQVRLCDGHSGRLLSRRADGKIASDKRLAAKPRLKLTLPAHFLPVSPQRVERAGPGISRRIAARPCRDQAALGRVLRNIGSICGCWPGHRWGAARAARPVRPGAGYALRPSATSPVRRQRRGGVGRLAAANPGATWPTRQAPPAQRVTWAAKSWMSSSSRPTRHWQAPISTPSVQAAPRTGGRAG
jgi:hypothetical protein